MRIGKMLAGFFASVMACILSVLLTIVVINSELIMFDRYDLNKMILTLMCPVIVQLVFYLTWFMIKAREDSRNANKLARGSLLVCLLSIAASALLLFGMASLCSLWEEGSLFLMVAVVLYVLAGMIQYIFCRPY